MEKKIEVLVFDPKVGAFINAAVEQHSLKSYYNLLGCQMIEKVTIHDCCSFEFDIILDEEGKFKENWIPAYNLYDRDLIAGKIMFSRADDEGNWIGLTEEEKNEIKSMHLIKKHVLNATKEDFSMLVRK